VDGEDEARRRVYGSFEGFVGYWVWLAGLGLFWHALAPLDKHSLARY